MVLSVARLLSIILVVIMVKVAAIKREDVGRLLLDNVVVFQYFNILLVVANAVVEVFLIIFILFL